MLFNNFEKIYAPISGKVEDIEKVPDPTFADKMLGDGVAIIPNEGIVKSPVDGKVSLIFDTGHAVSITSSKGIEVLIHIGLETVELKGDGFEKFVKNEDQVKKGDVLIKFDLEKISKNYNIITPVVITNFPKEVKKHNVGEEIKISDDVILEVKQ
jgi:glucose-specific phosphotransferase system IIA component